MPLETKGGDGYKFCILSVNDEQWIGKRVAMEKSRINSVT